MQGNVENKMSGIFKSRECTVQFLLSLAVAFAFIYAAIRGFMMPEDWIGYFPAFLKGRVPDSTLLSAWGIIEIILALWILSGRKIFIPCIIGAFSLFALIAGNLNQMDVLFRDVTIMVTLVALAVWRWND